MSRYQLIERSLCVRCLEGARHFGARCWSPVPQAGATARNSGRDRPRCRIKTEGRGIGDTPKTISLPKFQHRHINLGGFELAADPVFGFAVDV